VLRFCSSKSSSTVSTQWSEYEVGLFAPPIEQEHSRPLKRLSFYLA